MDPNEAKAKRTSAKRIFTRKKNACLHAVVDELGDEIVNQRFGEVENAWKNAQLTHEKYIQASGFPDNSDLDEWILELETTFQELELKRFAYFKKREEDNVKIKEEVRISLEHEAETSRNYEQNEAIKKAKRLRKMQFSLFQNQADFLQSTLSSVVSNTNPIEVAATAYDSLLLLFGYKIYLRLFDFNAKIL